ncbi:MAG: PAS domain-containing sensor histidine kinase [Bdellovibrionales bacterium]|nr:PAS domain-containing sensor histidine kinase [Bdellovibrionales bacterium]
MGNLDRATADAAPKSPVRWQSLDFSKSSSQLLTVQTVRMAFLAIVLSLTVIYQVLNSSFISFEIFFSVYCLLAVSFLLNSAYILFLSSALKHWYWTGILFVWETVYVSCLIYFIGVNQSLLVLLYLINILLCGVVFQRRGGIYLALITSLAFSVLLSIDKSIQGNTLYLAVGINNLAFFTVAYLSGYLSEQLNFMGVELQERGRDIRVLKNLNSLILNNIGSGLLTIDNAGFVLQENPHALSLLGLSSSAIGKKVDSIFSPATLLLNSDFLGIKDIKITDDQGELKTLRVKVSKLLDESEKKQGAILTFEDVTELTKLQGRVQQSEKLAAIGQLAAGIAHEIRNPLASISGSVQLMQSNANADSEDQTLMRIVIKEIDRLNKLITEFLDYAKPQAPLDDTIDLSFLLAEIVDAIKLDSSSKDVEFMLSISSGVVVQGHRDKIKQALWNIIINGLQAMEGKPRRRMEIQLKKQAEITLSIKDYGTGIKPEHIHKIFEPFHTTKSKGTGLGLAIVHSILETHKATVDVRSHYGEWTEMVITFSTPS